MPRKLDRVRVLVLSGAGIAAFYAAAHLSRASAGSNEGLSAESRAASASMSASIPAAPKPAVTAVAASASPSNSAGANPATTVVASVRQVERAPMIPHDTGEPFSTLSWLPPPPPPPAPVAATPPPPPTAPVAPALPFVFVGMVEQGTPKPQAFLSKGDALLIVSAGETIDNGAYRVDALSGAEIILVHIATNTRQSINITGAAR